MELKHSVPKVGYPNLDLGRFWLEYSLTFSTRTLKIINCINACSSIKTWLISTLVNILFTVCSAISWCTVAMKCSKFIFTFATVLAGTTMTLTLVNIVLASVTFQSLATNARKFASMIIGLAFIPIATRICPVRSCSVTEITITAFVALIIWNYN